VGNGLLMRESNSQESRKEHVDLTHHIPASVFNSADPEIVNVPQCRGRPALVARPVRG